MKASFLALLLIFINIFPLPILGMKKVVSSVIKVGEVIFDLSKVSDSKLDCSKIGTNDSSEDEKKKQLSPKLSKIIIDAHNEVEEEIEEKKFWISETDRRKKFLEFTDTINTKYSFIEINRKYSLEELHKKFPYASNKTLIELKFLLGVAESLQKQDKKLDSYRNLIKTEENKFMKKLHERSLNSEKKKLLDDETYDNICLVLDNYSIYKDFLWKLQEEFALNDAQEVLEVQNSNDIDAEFKILKFLVKDFETPELQGMINNLSPFKEYDFSLLKKIIVDHKEYDANSVITNKIKSFKLYNFELLNQQFGSKNELNNIFSNNDTKTGIKITIDSGTWLIKEYKEYLEQQENIRYKDLYFINYLMKKNQYSSSEKDKIVGFVNNNIELVEAGITKFGNELLLLHNKCNENNNENNIELIEDLN